LKKPGLKKARAFLPGFFGLFQVKLEKARKTRKSPGFLGLFQEIFKNVAFDFLCKNHQFYIIQYHTIYHLSLLFVCYTVILCNNTNICTFISGYDLMISFLFSQDIVTSMKFGYGFC